MSKSNDGDEVVLELTIREAEVLLAAMGPSPGYGFDCASSDVYCALEDALDEATGGDYAVLRVNGRVDMPRDIPEEVKVND